ncbi:MAG: hypothetical protein Q7S47_01500 [bacterium]|nr:hypothetical protein [bacterium]
MAKSAQEIFIEIQELKKQQKDIRKMVNDARAGSPEFQQTKAELEALRQKKKTIEAGIMREFERELTKLDDLKIDLETEQEELSDVVLTQLMKGEIVKVHDAYNNSFEVVVKLNFKKSDDQETSTF